MYLTTGINREMLKFVEPVPHGLAELVQFLGGTKAAGQFIVVESGRYKGKQGVTERAVQRYLAEEGQGATERRRISDANRQRLIDAAATKSLSGTIEQMQRRGLKVSGRMQLYVSRGRTYVGERNVVGELYGEALDDFLNAWLSAIVGGATKDEMAEAFSAALMAPSAYDFPGAEIDAGPNALDRDDFSITYAT